MAAELTSHVHIDDAGVAWVDETNIKVIEVALDHLSHGSSPQEIHFQYPHLSLAQIHAALAHYYDHRATFDQQICEQLDKVDALAAAERERSPARQRLREKGLLD